MKTIGLLGGMSWESTASYYRRINSLIKRQLGGLHSAQIAMVSVDFASIEACQKRGEWDKAGLLLANAAQQVQAAGADFLLLCTNTMHIVTPAIEAAISIPLLHIADATGATLKAQGIKHVGLLGTQFTMQRPFYKQRLMDKFGLNVLTPVCDDQMIIDSVIFDELCQGKLENTSQQEYIRIIEQLYKEGAQGVILGCTEIGLLISQKDTRVPLFDTTQIHAEYAVKEALRAD